MKILEKLGKILEFRNRRKISFIHFIISIISLVRKLPLGCVVSQYRFPPSVQWGLAEIRRGGPGPPKGCNSKLIREGGPLGGWNSKLIIEGGPPGGCYSNFKLIREGGPPEGWNLKLICESHQFDATVSTLGS